VSAIIISLSLLLTKHYESHPVLIQSPKFLTFSAVFEAFFEVEVEFFLPRVAYLNGNV